MSSMISKQAQVRFSWNSSLEKGGDVTDVNAMEFIYLNDHSWLVINLYLIFSLVLVHF
jgi:hypothetical protein